MKPAESFSALLSQRRQDVFLSVQLSQPYIAAGHTSDFISRIFIEIGMLRLFHIFCSDVLIACPLFNLVWNSVIHLPSTVIRDPRYGNILNEYRMHHSVLPLSWSCRRWWLGCVYGWLGLDDLPDPVVLLQKWSTRWCHGHSEGSWLSTLQFLVHLEIHWGFL